MRYEAPNMQGWSAADQQRWEQASEQDRLRSMVSVADLVEEDRADPNTPDHFDVEMKTEEDEDSADDPVPVHGMTVASSSVVLHMRRIRDRLRSWGWTVQEMSGWETRGVRVLTPSYDGQHHTGATVDIDRILRDGRSDLNGPLCNFAVHADGVIVLVAAGTANHFGVATIDNDEAYGVEVTGPIPLSNTGRDAFPNNYKAQTALSVAIRMEHGWPVSRIVGHKETARPDGRKPDPAFEEGRPGDGYPAPYPEMDRYRAACNVSKITKEDEDVPNTEQEIKTWVNDCLENKLALLGGTNQALGIYGQRSNNNVWPKVLNTQDPTSVVSLVMGLVKSVADLTTLVGAMKADLSDDEAKIVANANARADEIKSAISALEDPEADTPPVTT